MATSSEFIDDAEEQLSLSGRTEEEVRVVLDIIELLTDDWPDLDHQWVLASALTLMNGGRIEPKREEVVDEREWAPILLGDGTRPGHPVRVKAGAYTTGAQADQHNGRTGTFAGARNGFVYVKYDDETRDVHPVGHRPDLVEKLVSQM